MKVNDIFEREIDGNVYRFKLTELKPHKVHVELLDDSLRIEKDICSHLAPPFPAYDFASMERGEFVSTKEGDNEIEKLALEIYKRIKDWRFSIQWACSKTSLKNDEAEELVAKMNLALYPRFNDSRSYHFRYLPIIVRWACYGEVDPDNETGIDRMRNLLSSFHDQMDRRNKEEVATVGYKVEFDDNGFKRRNVDGTETRLERMEETEDALRPWLSL